MIPKNIVNIFIVFAISALPLALASCSDRPAKIIEENRIFMSTTVQIKVSLSPGDDENKVRAAINKAFEEIKRIEDVYSVYNPESEISKINRLRKNERLQIPDGVFNLLHKTLHYSEKTQGAFDITVKPLIDLWKKASAAKNIPDEYELKRALEHVGYKNVVLDEVARTIYFKKDGMSVDLGGAAKGYATDRAVTILRDNGIDNALVTSGGDMYCLGRRSGRQLWRVGVRHPRDKDKTFIDISLEDRAISTSGDYERYYTVGQKRYSHIIDPRTGYPLRDYVISASVISSDSTTSDILATAMCVLGKKGLPVLKSIGGIEAILVLKDGDRLTVEMSDGIRKRYDISKESF